MSNKLSIQNVIDEDFCIGCGSCNIINKDISIEENEYGLYKAKLNKNLTENLELSNVVCPFSNESDNEDTLSIKTLDTNKLEYDKNIGYYKSLYAGRINNKDKILKSSSGGITSWIIKSLLNLNEVDGVIHVYESQNEKLFEYGVSYSVEDVLSRGKSKYYSTSFNEVINKIKYDGKKYVFLGVPCFIKALKLLCEQDDKLKEQISYYISLICGHMKSKAFSESFAWQMGIEPWNLKSFDFRVKEETKSPGDYKVKAIHKNGEIKINQSNKLFGANWGHAFFQPKACDFCDDITGELADISLGDAWIPKYNENWLGTNIIVCRNHKLDDILLKGKIENTIYLEKIEVDDVILSQSGNFRHRRDGLSERMKIFKRKNKWYPTKRLSPGSIKNSFVRKKIIMQRSIMAEESHLKFLEAKKNKDLNIFFDSMKKHTNKMKFLYKVNRIFELEFYSLKLSKLKNKLKK